MNKYLNVTNITLLLIGLLETITNIKSLYIIFFIFILVSFLLNKLHVFYLVFYSLLIPMKSIQFMSIIIAIIILCQVKNNANYKSKIIPVFLFYIFLTSIIDISLNGGSIINVTFEFSIYFIYFYFIYLFLKKDISINNNIFFIQNLKQIIVLQLIISIIQYIKFKKFGDCITGTFISAHYYGIFTAIFLIYYIKCIQTAQIKEKKINIILIFLICFTSYLMNDAKHVYILLIFSLIVVELLKFITKKNIIVIGGIALLFFIILSLSILQKSNPISKFVKNYTFSEYIYNSNYNQKFIFFDRSFKTLNINKFLFGEGLGQYCSQIANYRAYDDFYHNIKAQARKNYFKSFILSDYKKNIQDLMVTEYINDVEKFSFVMSFPIESFISIFCELGFIGYILFLIVFQHLIEDESDSISIILFLLLSIFDIYFENPSVFMMIILFLSLMKKTKIVHFECGV